MTREEFQKRYIYDANSRIGGGRYGNVFKAWDNERDCYVALKVQVVDVKSPNTNLDKEVEMASRLKHNNIAYYETCYRFADLSGASDIAVMSYYDKGSLDKLIFNDDLTFEQREDILVQMLDGIAYLHHRGIIHRDLKPQNTLMLFLNGRYIPKITDFGISKEVRRENGSLVRGSIVGGTENYGSPEQMAGPNIRKNSDLWSFGIIALEVLCKSDKFNYHDINQGVLPTAVCQLPMQWQALIRQCLIPNPNKRISSADECMEILGRKLSFDPKNIDMESVTKIEVSKNVTDNTSTIVSANRPQKKRSVLWIILLVLFALVVGAGVALYLTSDKSPNVESVEIVDETAVEIESKTDEGAPVTIEDEKPHAEETPEVDDRGMDENPSPKPVVGGETSPKPVVGGETSPKSVGGSEKSDKVAPAKKGEEAIVETGKTAGQNNGGTTGGGQSTPTPPEGTKPYTHGSTSMNISSDGGSFSVHYKHDGTVKPGVGTSAPTWITHPHYENGQIVFSVKENKSKRERTGEITVKPNKGDEYIIKVVQSGKVE